MDMVITAGVDPSRAACNEILSVVSLMTMVFSAGKPSGKAEANAHSSSSSAGIGAGGFGLAKSNIEAGGCCGVDVRIGEVKAAKGSEGAAGVCCFAIASVCCC